MNTKSFVNQMDADNVVKGYYDESDHLVMVEPEGSGGNDFTTCKVTFYGAISRNFVTAPYIYESELDAYIEDAGTYDVVLYNGHCVVSVVDFSPTPTTAVAVDGDAEITSSGAESGHWIIKVSGDATITVSTAGGDQ